MLRSKSNSFILTGYSPFLRVRLLSNIILTFIVFLFAKYLQGLVCKYGYLLSNMGILRLKTDGYETKKQPQYPCNYLIFSGESEIRTRGTLLAHTRFPGVPLQPLEHLSKKIRLPYVVVKSKRRDRDSNPGNLAVQRFSRPPQSTTLPPLQYYKEKSFLQSRAKVQIIFKSTSSLLFFHDLIVLLQHDLPTKLWA